MIASFLQFKDDVSTIINFDLHMTGCDLRVFVLDADFVSVSRDLFYEGLDRPSDQLRSSLLNLANLLVLSLIHI